MKKCSRCLQIKHLDDFHKQKSTKDGRFCYCKNCTSIYKMKAYWKDVEKARATSMYWYWNNIESARESRRKWHSDNRDKRLEQMSNNGYKRRQKLGRSEQDRVNAAQRANPEARRNREAKRRLKKINGDGVIEDVHALVVLEMDDGVCGICGLDVQPDDFHVDHIIPLSLGGGHSYANVQVAHLSCNIRKSNKVI